jgi:hypothetical protein
MTSHPQKGRKWTMQGSNNSEAESSMAGSGKWKQVTMGVDNTQENQQVDNVEEESEDEGLLIGDLSSQEVKF